MRSYLIRFLTIFCLTMAIAAPAGYFLYTFAENSMRKQGELTNITFSQTFVNQQQFNGSMTGFIEHSSSLEENHQLLLHTFADNLRKQAISLSEELPILKIKLLDLKGRTIFSIPGEDTGTIKDPKVYKGFAEALTGKIYTEESYKESMYTLHGRITDIHRLSTYIPVYHHTDLYKIIGVMEIYSDISHFEKELLVFGEHMALSIIVASLLLSISLTLIFESIHAKLRRAAEAEQQSNRAKSQFLANMSHEIRTPLNGIMGLADILLDTKLTATQIEHLKLLSTTSRHLLTIINDVLDISKIEAGKIEIEAIPFKLLPTINAVIATQTTAAEKKHIPLTLHIKENELPTWIESDSHRLQQILNNLVNNAIKFTTSGKIDVFVKTYTQSQKSILEIQVKDTGIGMYPEQLETIFEKFKQADDSITRKYGGTGLGMSICRQLVELMNGTIHVKSAPKEGSTFTVTLPIKEVAAPIEDITKKENLSLGKGKHILLVEDNAINQLVAKAVIAKYGYTVTIANNGEEAVEILNTAKKPFSLIFMDLQMPIMDGYQATKEIRRQIHQKIVQPVPIIALTANALQGERDKCIEHGMTDYLSKPINKAELYHMLEKYAQ